jgi:phage terminase large subunit-like protein
MDDIGFLPPHHDKTAYEQREQAIHVAMQQTAFPEMTEEEAFKVVEAMEEWKLLLYEPYDKQREFHDLGATKRERCLLAGNKVGKTLGASREFAMHITGRYPDDWKGKRFDKPIIGWAAGQTFEMVRENAQYMLFGQEPYGRAAIPKADIIKTYPRSGIAGSIDYATIKHQSGGISEIKFKCYKQDPFDWAGPGVDVLWCDEEPSEEHYSQGMARLMEKRGITMLTFTPELGLTAVLEYFFPEPNHPERSLTRMRMSDAPHFANDPEFMENEVTRYPKHQREMRINGEPMMGTGLIFPLEEETFLVQPFDIPNHWAWLGGIDFGGGGDGAHPTACVWATHDRDSDVIYIVREYRHGPRDSAEWTSSSDHATAMRQYQPWMPWAWPHDGFKQDGSASPVTVADTYRNSPNNINMLWERATFDGKHAGVEAGIDLMLNWFRQGKLKVFDTCFKLRTELRQYHRMDGVIQKTNDDLCDALRYFAMMTRFAQTPPRATMRRDVEDYNPLTRVVGSGHRVGQGRYNALTGRRL